MMTGFSRRGQPLLALVLVIGGWVSARAMMWEPDAGKRVDLAVKIERLAEPPAQPARRGPAGMSLARLAPAPLAAPAEPGTEEASEASAAPASAAPLYQPSPSLRELVRHEMPSHRASLPPPAPRPSFPPVPLRTTIGHHLLWMAALSRMPLPAALAALPPEASAGAALVPLAGSAPPTAAHSRWSADSWVLWRRGSAGAASGALLTPSYGASQAGAVLRYRLAPGIAVKPTVYLRTTAALNGTNEREAALGLSLRPIAGLPIAVAGEARLTNLPGRTFVRPAAYAVTELPPFGLPLGLRGEAYGQAGYVGGRFATGFADGQLRVDGRLLPLGRGDLRLGGGVWGGVQKGASRLDAGPTLTIGQPLGSSSAARLSADWRFRVAGKAAPGSGPAVTLSAGF